MTGTGRRASLRQSNRPSIKMSSNFQSSAANGSSPLDKFPPFVDHMSTGPHDPPPTQPSDARATLASHPNNSDFWQPRKPGGHVLWDQSARLPKHRPRKSISEAISTIRSRNASMTANAQEIAEALRAPISYKLISLCLIWYMTSALTNTSSKSILNALPKPVTLTILQFASVPIWCLILTSLSDLFPVLKRAVPALKNGIAPISREVVTTALPLAGFQLAGHILSSMATSQIPVSLVHTIKGLSPLFTVLAYRVLFGIKYARATYLSLVPLTIGVMLACSTGFSTNFFGIFCALLAALVFVSQNIFSKKLFNEAARAESEPQTGGRRKLDKLNLMYYCSGLAFLLTLPIWFMSEGYGLMRELLTQGTIELTGKKGSLDHGALFLEFIFNGLSHFAQNILAFVLLSMISPVSYSVASLIKRVFVIVVAIVWFGSPTTPVQALGIALTFLGLYLYDRNSHDDLADKRANADYFRRRETVLPLNSNPSSRRRDSNRFHFPGRKINEDVIPEVSAEAKKDDDHLGHSSRTRGTSPSHGWLPPGTKQETTWQPGDAASPTSEG